jgi:uncharacterized protein (UPF0254 family)
MASHKVAGFLPCFKLGEDHILTITGRHFKAPLVVAIEDSENAYTWAVDQASVKILTHQKLTVKAKPNVRVGVTAGAGEGDLTITVTQNATVQTFSQDVSYQNPNP